MVCFLMETRLDKEGFDKLYGDLSYQNRIIVKQPDTRGGLAMLWKTDVNVELVNFTTNHILVNVKEDDGFMCFLSGFYGWPDQAQHTKSWALLNHLKTLVDGPWLCIGDFNAIIHSSEKLSRRPCQMSQVELFREALDDCKLEDLGYHGYPYTWNNKRPGDANTKVRLERAVATREWRDKFPLSKLFHLSPYASDHLPILLQMKSYAKHGANRSGGFKFEEAWLMWEECGGVVENAWNMHGNEGFGLAQVK